LPRAKFIRPKHPGQKIEQHGNQREHYQEDQHWIADAGVAEVEPVADSRHQYQRCAGKSRHEAANQPSQHQQQSKTQTDDFSRRHAGSLTYRYKKAERQRREPGEIAFARKPVRAGRLVGRRCRAAPIFGLRSTAALP